MKKEIEIIDRIKRIDDIKRYFEKQLESRLGLIKVQSPLFVKSESGLQDDLTGKEKSISFKKDKDTFEIVHSLAKWKRDALARYHFPVHTGLYTDMKAIRKDEKVDDIHSLFVEQWDWEKVIEKDDRTIEYLKDTVRHIYKGIRETKKYIEKKYKKTSIILPKTIYFITSQELEDKYPDKTPKEREYIITKEKKAVFIIGIGDKLKSGILHDLRSPDYDDWKLDGDMLIYDKKIDKAVEITSMGIRVDKKALLYQLKEADCLDRLKYSYHKKIKEGLLPYTIGGGIGQSRILLLLLDKIHIAEVQASSWEDKTIYDLKDLQIL